ERRCYGIAGEEARRKGLQGADRHSFSRPLRRDRGSPRRLFVDFHAEWPNDSSRFVESWGVLLERTPDERLRCRIRLLLQNLRMENHPGHGDGTNGDLPGF